MGQNPSKGGGGEKYNALRMSGLTAQKKITVKLKDGTNVDLENVCKLYGENYNQDKEDAKQLLNVIESNFDRLLRTKERRQSLVELPKEAFLNILKSNDLYAANEYAILVLVGAWVDRRISEREERRKKKSAKKEKKKKKKSASTTTATPAPSEEPAKKEEEFIDPYLLEEQLKKKQEEEDAILAALLQNAGDDADLNQLVTKATTLSIDTDEPEFLDEETVSGFLTNIKDVVIPSEKLKQAYEDKLRDGIAEFAEFIRFPTMSVEHLELVMSEGLVPEKYIHEAVRYHAMADLDEDTYKKLKQNNIRFKSRSHYFTAVWDPKKKDTRLNVSKDGYTVTVNPGSGCAHKAVIGKYPITSGRAVFELTLGQRAGCYDAIGVVDPKFKVGSDQIIGIFPNSFGLGLYAGTHVATSNRRIQIPSMGSMNHGTKIKVVVDMDLGYIEFFISGSSQGKLKGLRGPLYPAMTMCEMTGSGHTIRNLPNA